MTAYDFVFLSLNGLAGLGWLCLVLAPKSALTERVVHHGAVILLLSLGYLALLFCGVVLGMSAPDAGMGSLAAVGALFSHPVGILTGWAHFLAFDLFVGAWIARDGARLGFSHLSQLPALIFAFLFGPLGLTIHLLRRGLGGHGWSL